MEAQAIKGLNLEKTEKGNYKITGDDTYKYRTHLKNLGAFYHRKNKCWYVNEEKVAGVKEFIQTGIAPAIDVKKEEKEEEHVPPKDPIPEVSEAPSQAEDLLTKIFASIKTETSDIVRLLTDLVNESKKQTQLLENMQTIPKTTSPVKKFEELDEEPEEEFEPEEEEEPEEDESEEEEDESEEEEDESEEEDEKPVVKGKPAKKK